MKRASNQLVRRLLPIGLVTSWVACRGATLAHIDIDGNDTLVVPGGNILEDLLGDIGFDGFTNMNLTESKKLKNQGVSPGDIQDVRLVSFELEVLDPDDGDLSFFSSIDVWVNAPGLSPVLIASSEDFGDGVRVVSFDVMDVDITDYVVSESMTLSTDIVANSPRDDTRLKASYLLDVGVTAQGIRKKACE